MYIRGDVKNHSNMDVCGLFVTVWSEVSFPDDRVQGTDILKKAGRLLLISSLMPGKNCMYSGTS